MAETGYLTVRTYASRAQLPIEGAVVTLTQPTAQGSKLIASRITDENGQISVIPIPTPNRTESLSPGAAKPFATVELTVDHPSYDRVLIENLQIFSDIVTQQNIALLPRSDLPEAYNLTEVVDITAQPL